MLRLLGLLGHRPMPSSAQDWQLRKQREQARAEHTAAGGGCDLCGAKLGEKGLCGTVPRRGFDFDHDHASGEFRGFLCARANRQLWTWASPAWLRAAADYLERAR